MGHQRFPYARDDGVTTTKLRVELRSGRPVLVDEPGGTVEGRLDVNEQFLGIALRGEGDVEIYIAVAVADVDVRGGFAFVEPGMPCRVRTRVDGWLSLTVRRAATPRR
jgi:hypothetical protein